MVPSKRLQHASEQYRHRLRKAAATLPGLRARAGDRARSGALCEQLLQDPRLISQGVTDEQRAMLARIDDALAVATTPATDVRGKATRRAAASGTRR